jgi:ATP-dependent Clp protease ATP-binding subunit ClpC
MIIFSQKFLQTIKRSVGLCQQEKALEITPKHLFNALEKTQGSLAYDILAQIRSLAKSQAPELKSDNKKVPPFNKKTVKLIERAATISFGHQHHYVGTEHLLAAFLEMKDQELNNFNIPIKKIRKHLITVLDSSSHVPNFSKLFNSSSAQQTSIENPQQASSLEYFTVDLTSPVNHQDLNPVIGRDDELTRMIQILCRKDKNNPVILGEAGVGKTALVEGLARKIANREVPPLLLNKKILNLDLGQMVAGTMYRGEFENRLKSVMDEVASDPNVILFIDELHNIMGAGSANGSMDAANLLKPVLSRGQLRCIGATTLDEFKKHIETDPALERRFQPVILNEPSTDDTHKILQGVKYNYQNYHGVEFSDEALTAAVELSQRYIQDKLMPDKAIDLIDEAAATVKIKYQNKDTYLRKIAALEDELNKIKDEKGKAILNEDYNQAIRWKQKEGQLKQKLHETGVERNKVQKNKTFKVEKQDIVNVLTQKTKISPHEIQETEFIRLNKINDKLKKIVIGQNIAIDSIMRAITQAKLGLTDENKPLASFLLVGSSGVGKTYLARQLAKQLFKSEESLIQLDMSEFSEKFQASKLIGAPAGYIGFRDGNKFTDLVRKNPHSVVLLDEVEKAHPDVLNLLLQILEHGHLTDSTGKKINFKNTIIFLTSNALGSDQSNQIGFGSKEKAEHNHLVTQIKKIIKPELVNRLDQIVHFPNLEKEHLNDISKLEVRKLVDRLKVKGVNIKPTTGVLRFVGQLSHEKNAGARGVHQVIKQNIESCLLETLIKKNKKDLQLIKHQNKIIVK